MAISRIFGIVPDEVNVIPCDCTAQINSPASLLRRTGSISLFIVLLGCSLFAHEVFSPGTIAENNEQTAKDRRDNYSYDYNVR